MIFRLSGLLAPFFLYALSPSLLAAREPVAVNATVSAADPRAAEAGQDILRRGGSATAQGFSLIAAGFVEKRVTASLRGDQIDARR